MAQLTPGNVLQPCSVLPGKGKTGNLSPKATRPSFIFNHLTGPEFDSPESAVSGSGTARRERIAGILLFAGS